MSFYTFFSMKQSGTTENTLIQSLNHAETSSHHITSIDCEDWPGLCKPLPSSL